VDSREFTSKSEVVNDLIRKAREIETIRARLIAAEQSGLSSRGPQEIRDEVKGQLKRES